MGHMGRHQVAGLERHVRTCLTHLLGPLVDLEEDDVVDAYRRRRSQPSQLDQSVQNQSGGDQTTRGGESAICARVVLFSGGKEVEGGGGGSN